MTNGSADAAGLRHLHTLYRVGVLGDLSDAQLLERYVAGLDEGAEAGFTALVERHGPMVLRVCRRILGDPHDAEDAFQATFLVLARRAGSVRRRDSVASWLHGIARRVAMHARADAARRRRHERRGAALRDAESPDDADEAHLEGWPELHEELARLPSAYRESVVLCYLEGLTTAAAARRLGCAQGTVLARLSRARARLRRRLIGRGLTLSAELLTAGLSPGAARAAVPAELSRSVMPAAMRIAAGTTAAGVVPASVVALAEGVLSMLFRSRLGGILGTVAAFGAVALGIGMLAHRSAGARPQVPPAAPAGKSAAHAARGDDPPRSKDGRTAELVVRAADMSREPGVERFMGIAAIGPETGQWRTIYKGPSIGPGRVSPDGRYLVYSGLGVDLPPALTGIWVYDMTGQKTLPWRIFDRSGEPFWIDDGRQVVIGTRTDPGSNRYETWRVNADGSGRTRLPIPEGDLVLDASRDGTWLATRTLGGDPKHHGRLTLIHPDGTGARYLTEGSAKDDRFSIFKIAPDGRSVAYAEITTVDKIQMGGGATILDKIRHAELFIVDIEGRQRRRIPTKFEPGTTVTVCWSPDGSRLALNLLNGETKEGSIVLVDLDGPNYRFRKVALPPGRWNLLVCDWATLAPGLRLGAVDEPPDLQTPRGRYQALRQEFEKAGGSLPRARSYAGRFLQLAESAPEDPSAVDALIWIVQFCFAGPEFDRAVELLARSYASERKVGHAAASLVNKPSLSSEGLLRAVIDKSPDRTIRGLACLALGRYLRNQSEGVRSIQEDKENAARLEAFLREEGADKESFVLFRRRDPGALMTQAEAALERAAEEFGDLPGSRDGTLGQEARDELNEMRNLVPGKPAPEVTGVDVDDRPMKLSDYRGQVVLISFWGQRWGSLRGQVPSDRVLATRMKDRPFVLLGVNDEDDKEPLRALIKQEGITWRSWWDRGGRNHSPGPIARRFNVHTRPTYYVIDHRGTIRHKFIGTPGAGKLDAAIDELVTAAERDPDATKP